tara:strand:- start:4584 stop:7193 length:2610 start_codon:yes stop_codon:yes gene_type:complete
VLLSDSRAVVRLVQQAMQPEGGSAQVRQDKGAHRDLKDTMNKELFDLISEQTLNDEALRPAERDFVLAACEDRLGKHAEEDTVEEEAEAVVPKTTAPMLFLKSLTVEGYQGIGAPACLELPTGPGLTIISGRNGSGKSSIAEALENLLTDSSARWVDKAKEWKTGWKNIHYEGAPRICASFADATGAVEYTATRTWAAGSTSLKKSEAWVCSNAGSIDSSNGAEHRLPLTAFPGLDVISMYDPLLGCSSLSKLIATTPSELFDSVSELLGLEELTDAKRRLSQAAKVHTDRQSELSKKAEALRPMLDSLDDSRANACVDALEEANWGIPELRKQLSIVPSADRDATQLQQIRQLTFPATEELAVLCENVRAANRVLDEQERSDAGRAAKLAELLKASLDYHEHSSATEAEPDACPVCLSEAKLDAAWRIEARKRADDAVSRAPQYKNAKAAVSQANDALLAQCQVASIGNLPAIRALELDNDAQALCEVWRSSLSQPSASPEQRVKFACEHQEAIRAVITHAKARATEILSERDAPWRKVLPVVQAFVDEAQVSLDAEDHTRGPQLKSAHNWLSQAEVSLREKRFTPLAEQICSVWETLRQGSNVSLSLPSLHSKGKMRKLVLDTKVDDSEESRSAFGIMSQGELNALALSLFLPRVLSDKTPFGFVVIDDPVHSMDPHKVDGLATVLGEVSQTRQVVVFTHDPRLTESLARLRIPAGRIQVNRASDSKVELKNVLWPSEQYLNDAVKLLETPDAIPNNLLARMVPGFCRLAVEAAAQKIAINKVGHEETGGELVRKAQGTRQLIGLAVMGLAHKKAKSADVAEALRRSLGNHEPVLDEINPHHLFEGDLKSLVSRVRKLVRHLEEAHA